MKRLARLAALALPVAGLAALWLQSDRTYHSGTEWEVPIMGYDPRDYLRGHYVEFSYDWPGSERLGDIIYDALCLEGEAPVVANVVWLNDGQKCDHPVRADASGVYQGDALWRGRLYIGQDRARTLEEQLQNRDQRGIVTIRQREDGSFTPIGIRFRPLTPEEIAARDPPANEEAEDQRPPPPIMSE
ncbi:GDYXXLXY domain-containing protein [Porphyrobacter sp. HT-58-2]|uniref:GDYXXLXY domain-containing protein n=1 Tax=Porphyrobacter sp. HT-58-2 TaxID=2023229 RepID=UPI001559CFE7|nr:GDYXXLXY domain-containing protein [Porphyrobacter sp. HT-58-2]